MKVTKLPDEFDPNYIIKKKCMERDFICPYCGTSNNKFKFKKMAKFLDWYTAWIRTSELYKTDMPIEWQEETWYGYQDHKKHLFSTKERQKWAQFKCHCTQCNAEWKGEPFIILSKKELKG